MTDKLHDIKATCNPSQKTMIKEVTSYRNFMAGFALAEGGDYSKTVPSRKAQCPVQRFKFYHMRFQTLLESVASPERDIALLILHDRLYRLCTDAINC